MPPKKTKKKTSQVANPAQQETTAEDLEKEIERKALAEEAKRLFDLTKKEETSYNEYQQQRERINYFWIVEKKRLEDRTAELMNKERELQDLIEKNKVEIKVYKQRVKHLLHEHQNEITQLKTGEHLLLRIRLYPFFFFSFFSFPYSSPASSGSLLAHPSERGRERESEI